MTTAGYVAQRNGAYLAQLYPEANAATAAAPADQLVDAAWSRDAAMARLQTMARGFGFTGKATWDEREPARRWAMLMTDGSGR